MSPAKRTWAAVPAANAAMPPAGHYSSAVRAGQHLYVAGMTPRDPATGDFGPADVRVQARRCLGNLRIVLEASGASLGDVVQVLVHLRHVGDRDAFEAVWSEFFEAPYPARTIVGAELRGTMLVEVSATAYLGDGRSFDPRMTLV
ncbi:MAG: RidA family protein [Gemmatimonadota bacterium]|jgi:2-iminobutanoate/2-iminopropanoate deaminase|nr:RidA family protein [Gemmatimonadota bacterium]